MPQRPQLDPVTGEPIASARAPIDPSTGEPMALPSAATLAPVNVTPDIAADMFKAGIHSKMLDVTPGFAYENRDEINKQIGDRAEGYDDGQLDPTIANDIKVGLEGSISGLYKRNKLPEELRNPGKIDRFVEGIGQMVGDLPGMIAGGLAGGAAGSEAPVVGNALGAAAGAFAAPAGIREALTEGIKNGKVKSFGDLMHRAADITWAATKGALTGAATEATGGIPVAGFIAKSPAGTMAVKGLYQATAITAVGDILDGRMPNADDFASNAALIVPLNLITHGMALRTDRAKQATMDVYAKDGTTPEATTDKLQAQPPVKPDAPPGLRPAIKLGKTYIDGDYGETHDELADRLGNKPVTMEQLNADPSLALKVLQEPETHSQDVIDGAWVLWDDMMVSAKEGTPDADAEVDRQRLQAQRGNLKSGRGFVTPEGKFLTREQARSWVKNKEPDVHEMWSNVAGSDTEELHSEDYNEARERVQDRTVAEGDSVISNLAPENARRLGAARAGLNKIKAGLESKGYGNEVLRTLFTGQRDARITATTQLRDSLKKLIPNFHDQEALSIFRDYKGDPEKLSSTLEQIRNGDSDRLKALIPSIERAMNPTPEMLEADGKLTEYYDAALNEGREFGIPGLSGSTIDSSNYSPHIMTRIIDGEKASSTASRPAMSRKTPFGKERKYPTILDAMRDGKNDASTINSLDALSVYGDRHATVVATRLLTRELTNTGLGVEGSKENHPDNWSPLAPGESLYVPKQVSDAMKPMFEQGLAGTAYAPLLKVQGYVKGLELGLSLFHVKALNITAFNNMGLSDFTKSLVADTKSPEFAEAEKGWAADGLTTAKTTTPYEAYEGLRKSSIPTGFDKLANAPIIKQIDGLFKSTTEYTFDVVQRKFKVMDASLKDASWRAKNPDATDEQIFSARRSIAKEVNAAYGGLNWDVLGTGKTVRDVSRLFLLAPDWTFSNVLNAKYTFEGGPAGSAARMFWSKSFATGIAMTAAMSVAIGGKYNSDAKHFDQVFLGKDKEGKEMYASWFFAGAPKDAMTLAKQSISNGPLAGTSAFVLNKATPLIGTLIALKSNKQASGKPIYNKKDSLGKNTLDQGEYAAERLIPITGTTAIETVERALKDPTHQWSYGDILELAADALGSGTYHESSHGGSTSPSRQSKSSRSGNSKRYSIRR